MKADFVESLLAAREKACRTGLRGWRVHDTSFLNWLSEQMGPENIEYLGLLIQAGGKLKEQVAKRRSFTHG